MPLSRSLPSEDPYRDVRVRQEDGTPRLPTEEEKAAWRNKARDKKWIRVRFLDLDGEGIFSTVFTDDEETGSPAADRQPSIADG
jgi:hypothetical protein